MGVFGAVFGCRGDAGFNGCCSGARSGVVGFKVATLCSSCAKKFALLGLIVGVSAKKFACALTMAQNWRFYACWASFFAEMPLKGPCWAIFSRQSALRPGLVGDVAHEAGCGGGFCSIRSWLEACRRRVVPLMTPFPPFGGGPAERRKRASAL